MKQQDSPLKITGEMSKQIMQTSMNEIGQINMNPPIAIKMLNHFTEFLFYNINAVPINFLTN